MPGHACVEIKQVYDRLKIPRKNIYAVTNDKAEYRKIKSGATGANVVFGDLYRFGAESIFSKLYAKNGARFFDLINFDFYGPIDGKIIQIERFLMLLRKSGVFGLTALGAREKTLSLATRLFPLDRNVMYARRLLMAALFSVIWGDMQRNRFWVELDENGRPYMEDKNCSYKLSSLWVKHWRGLARHGSIPSDMQKIKYAGTSRRPMHSFFIKFIPAKNISSASFFNIVHRLFVKHLTRKAVSINKQGRGDFIEKQTKLQIVDEHNTHVESFKVFKGSKKKKEQLVAFLKAFNSKKEDEKEIARLFDITPSQYRAYKAHITMGTYGP